MTAAASPASTAPTASPNHAFSSLTPGLQLFWDSTSLAALKRCPRYYEYSIIEGYVTRNLSPHLTFGLEFHAALEFYDHQRVQNIAHDEAMLTTLRRVFVRTWDFKLNRPWVSDEPTKNRETLVRSVVWYLDNFRDDLLETIILANGKPAVELSFRLDLGDSLTTAKGEAFWLCGHIDRLVRLQGRPRITDRKTTKNAITPAFFEHFTPHNQMSVYDIAGTAIYGAEPIDGIIIDACQVGTTFTRFQRGIVNRSTAQRNEFMRNLEFWLAQAQAFAVAGYWPQNDEACGMPHYNETTGAITGGCPYRNICSIDPSLRKQHLEAFYDKRTWDPTQARGDV